MNARPLSIPSAKNAWRVALFLASAAAVYAITLPLVEIPGLGMVRYTDQNPAGAKIIPCVFLVATLSALMGGRWPALLLAGFSAGILFADASVLAGQARELASLASASPDNDLIGKILNGLRFQPGLVLLIVCWTIWMILLLIPPARLPVSSRASR